MKPFELFKLLADENRLKIFIILMYSEVCICEIEKYLSMKQANVSKHMMKFKKLNIVESRKEAQWVYYCLNKEFVKKNQVLINYLKEKVNEFEDYSILQDKLKVRINCSKESIK